MRIITLGTGPFVVPTLQRLHASNHEVLLAVSRPPRGRRSPPAPMYLAADQLGIELWTPETINSAESLQRLAALEPDLLVVCDYGEILKRPALEVARLGGINLHGSLLPKYRGAAPVQWAVLNGDAETGNTVIQMTPGLDAGPCLGVGRTAIDPEETAGELESRLAELGAELVLRIVDQLDAGSARPVPQDGGQATKAPRLSKADGVIDWTRGANEIKNQVRAMQPWPRAYTHWLCKDGEPLRMIVHRVATVGADSTTVDANTAEASPGTVLEADGRLLIAAGSGAIELLEIQPAGKRTMTASEFLRGHPMKPGQQLGNP